MKGLFYGIYGNDSHNKLFAKGYIVYILQRYGLQHTANDFLLSKNNPL